MHSLQQASAATEFWGVALADGPPSSWVADRPAPAAVSDGLQFCISSAPDQRVIGQTAFGSPLGSEGDSRENLQRSIPTLQRSIVSWPS